MTKIFASLAFSVFAFACSSDSVFTNPYTIKGNIKNIYNSQIYLAAMKGDAYRIIDTATIHEGKFSFTLSGKENPGQYKLIPEVSLKQQGRNATLNSIDLIINHESIKLKTVFPFLTDSLQFTVSDENKIYYSYIRKEKELQTRLELLHPMLVNYPAGDTFYGTLVKQYNTLQTEKRHLIQQIVDSLPGTYAARLIAMQKSPFLDANLSEPVRLTYYKQHYFDELDFNDPELINSTAYTHSLIQYIMLYRNPQLSQAQLEKEFMQAVDTLLSHINENPVVYDFLLNYLMEGFEKLNLENVLRYIADNYVNTVCKSDNSTTVQRRLEAYSKMIPGQTAPDIDIPDQDNQTIKLSAIPRRYTLVIFWASWCPHCNEFMPKLKKWYDHRGTDLEVLAISIDTVKNDWIRNIKANGYSWLNGCDLKGWNGNAAKDYSLYATPTLFLLDRNRIILAKPLLYEEFIDAVERLDKK